MQDPTAGLCHPRRSSECSVLCAFCTGTRPSPANIVLRPTIPRVARPCRTCRHCRALLPSGLWIPTSALNTPRPTPTHPLHRAYALVLHRAYALVLHRLRVLDLYRPHVLHTYVPKKQETRPRSVLTLAPTARALSSQTATPWPLPKLLPHLLYQPSLPWSSWEAAQASPALSTRDERNLSCLAPPHDISEQPPWTATAPV